MLAFVIADVDHHIIDGINLAGLILGVVGSLFFTYDLLGRPGGPLRVFLRVFLPALLGTVIVGGISLALVSAAEQNGVSTASDSGAAVLAVTVIMAAFGAILGTFNGLFVDDPGVSERRRFFYSLRDAGAGFVVIVVSVTLALTIFDLLAHVDLAQDVFSANQLLSTAVTAAIGGVLAGVWRFMNRSRPQTRPRPRLFSGRGFLIGLGTGLVIPTLLLLGLFGFSGNGSLSADTVVGVVGFGLVAGMPGGGITGGISRYMFWWANSLPPRGLEVIGVLLILVGFAAQAVQPLLSFFDLAVSH